MPKTELECWVWADDPEDVFERIWEDEETYSLRHAEASQPKPGGARILYRVYVEEVKRAAN